MYGATAGVQGTVLYEEEERRADGERLFCLPQDRGLGYGSLKESLPKILGDCYRHFVLVMIGI